MGGNPSSSEGAQQPQQSLSIPKLRFEPSRNLCWLIFRDKLNVVRILLKPDGNHFAKATSVSFYFLDKLYKVKTSPKNTAIAIVFFFKPIHPVFEIGRA